MGERRVVGENTTAYDVLGFVSSVFGKSDMIQYYRSLSSCPVYVVHHEKVAQRQHEFKSQRRRFRHDDLSGLSGLSGLPNLPHYARTCSHLETCLLVLPILCRSLRSSCNASQKPVDLPCCMHPQTYLSTSILPWESTSCNEPWNRGYNLIHKIPRQS